jgi:MoxR-like ATPase
MEKSRDMRDYFDSLLVKDGFNLACRATESIEQNDEYINKNDLDNDSARESPQHEKAHARFARYEQPQNGLEDDVKTVIRYLNWHIDRIGSHVIGREDIIEQAFYAVLTEEHLLLLSRTGMAKSYLANYIFDSFDDLRVFASQASKDQTPDNYFGPYNIEDFKRGRIRHNLHGSIIEAHMVFLDEFFDASDVVLRSLLSVLNERKFINGQEQIDAAVHTAIATANYMRLNEVTEAVLDRFIYKAIIPEDNDTFNQFLIDHVYLQHSGRMNPAQRRTPFDKIKFLTSIVKNSNLHVKILVPDYVLYLKNIIINKYTSAMRVYDSNFFISPRKQAKLVDFLRASALLHERMMVNEHDLEKLYLPLCTLNSYVQNQENPVTEKDLYVKTFRETINYLNLSGALSQLELLLNINHIFNDVKTDPDRADSAAEKHGLMAGIKKIFIKLFPGHEEDEKITLKRLWQTVNELHPASQEIDELRRGIVREYCDLII